MENKKQGSIKDYFIRVLNGMALGLFSSLIIGLILKQIGTLAQLEALVSFGSVAQFMMGPAIGAAVAYSVGAPPLGIFAATVTGAIGAGTVKQGDLAEIFVARQQLVCGRRIFCPSAYPPICRNSINPKVHAEDV